MSKTPASSFAPAVARKRVLLIDGYATKRDLRSKIMRKLGVEVDCASDITQARAELGWEPKVQLAEGLTRTIDYFRGTLDL